MGIIDRYLLRNFLIAFAGVVVACAVVFALTEVLERFEDIVDNNCPLDKTILYFVFFLPYRLVQVLPLAAILAVLFSIGILAHRREMLAITASGRSPERAAAPLIAAGLAISVLTLLADQWLVPQTETLARHYRRVYIEGKASSDQNENVFANGDKHRFYMMERYSSPEGQMVGPTIVEVDEKTGHVQSRLSALTGVLINPSRGLEERTVWKAENAVTYTYDGKGMLSGVQRHDRPVTIELEKNLNRYLASKREPEEMGVFELLGYIRMLEARGDNPVAYVTHFWLKLVFPFATLVFVVAGFALAIHAQVGSIVTGFTRGIVFTLAFYTLVAFGQAFGQAGVASPLLSVFTPIFLFAALSWLLLRRSAHTMT